MPVPVGTPGPLADYLQQLEDRIAAREVPGSPLTLYAVASASLSTANAAEFPNTLLFVTDLLVLGYSDGSHWYRTDTGGVIV